MVRKTVILDDKLADGLSLLAKKDSRDFSGALRHAARIGLLAIENPELTVQEIKDIIEADAEFEQGRISRLDVRSL
ncbi:MAG: hypothetical protein FJY83_00945 [Candidatus Aminicenantes bacterium]|nr:hypothetical protein [Candidatus Aminicenantes bacterium]